MSRIVMILKTPGEIVKAMQAIRNAPIMSRVELKGPRRTIPQSDRMWAMLGDISKQKEHFGMKYDSETWKKIFMAELGREPQFVPSLYGEQPIEIGHSSSDLSKEEMSDLITLMLAWGDQNGVQFHDPESLRLASIGQREAA